MQILSSNVGPETGGPPGGKSHAKVLNNHTQPNDLSSLKSCVAFKKTDWKENEHLGCVRIGSVVSESDA